MMIRVGGTHSSRCAALIAVVTVVVLGLCPTVATAREIFLQESGHLRSVGEIGETVNEQGRATGTFNCAISVRLTFVSAVRGTATFTVKPKGGTVTGSGTARVKTEGPNDYFGGTISIAHGTGSYARASGTNIGISGVFSRETFDLAVNVHGHIRV